jgi:MFS family permease
MIVRALPRLSRARAGEHARLPGDYWRLLGAGAVSMTGTQVSALAMPLVAVLVLRASAGQVGALTACQPGAYLVAGVPAGLTADRIAHRTIMVACDVGRAAAMASVPLAAGLGALTLAQLYIAVCLTGVLSVFADVVRQATVPQIVPLEHLQAANARLAATQSVATAAGPGTAGFLIQLTGPALAVAADAISYAVSAVVLWGMKGIRRPADASGSLRAQAWSGMLFPLSTRPLRDLTISSAAYNFVTAAGAVALLLRLARDLHLQAALIGVLYSVGAVGAIAGAAASRRAASGLGMGPVLRLSLLTASAGAFLIALTGPGWLVAAGAAGLFVSGAGVAVYNITQVTLRQRLTPAPLLGRATGSTRLIVTGSVSLGAVAGGLLAGITSPELVLWLAAAGSVAVALGVSIALDVSPPPLACGGQSAVR